MVMFGTVGVFVKLVFFSSSFFDNLEKFSEKEILEKKLDRLQGQINANTLISFLIK